jgi:uncharacterized membrane protein YbaN (DUF454 family)
MSVRTVDAAPEGPPLPPHRRWALLALGWTAFGLGMIGLALPVLPTTPFLLVALWAFSRSSRRFHGWLWNHGLFGPPLRRWHRERALPWWTKAMALGSMAASLSYVALRVRPPWWALLAMAAVLVAGAGYVLRIPTRPRG